MPDLTYDFMILEQAYTRYEELRQVCMMTWDEPSLVKLDEAFRFACEAIGQKKFNTGEYILIHSLEVATIIAAEIGLEPDSVLTGMLHNIMYTGLEKEPLRNEILSHFGPAIYSILSGMAKINSLGTDTVELHPENYRNLLMALAGDVRVILIKTADRLQVMRNLEIYDEDARRRLVNETSHLYAPLAHQAGTCMLSIQKCRICA
jgi:GTP diphosphokinase / guanosine-3',5'-bis(diphosphate) 3'-diphosphatase